MSPTPMICVRLWKQLVARFQAPNPYVTKKLGLQELPMPLIADHVQFPLGNVPQLEWVDTIRTRLYVLRHDQCPSCLGEHLLLDHQKGVCICAACGYHVDEHAEDGVSFQQSVGGSLGYRRKSKFPRHMTTSASKRINHFKYWLQRLQGKERCKISRQELEALSKYFQGRPIDYDSIRLGLKQLGLQKYYPNTYYLLHHFTGEALVDFSPEHEKQLVDMFVLIQPAFTRHAGTRVNMISYTYLIRKFSELLGWEDVVWSVPSMKSDANIYRQDALWKKICEDVDFRFHRSVL